MLESIYHMTFKLFRNCFLAFCHYDIIMLKIIDQNKVSNP